MINSAIQMLFCHEPDLMGGGGAQWSAFIKNAQNQKMNAKLTEK